MRTIRGRYKVMTAIIDDPTLVESALLLGLPRVFVENRLRIAEQCSDRQSRVPIFRTLRWPAQQRRGNSSDVSAARWARPQRATLT